MEQPKGSSLVVDAPLPAARTEMDHDADDVGGDGGEVVRSVRVPGEEPQSSGRSHGRRQHSKDPLMTSSSPSISITSDPNPSGGRAWVCCLSSPSPS